MFRYKTVTNLIVVCILSIGLVSCSMFSKKTRDLPRNVPIVAQNPILPVQPQTAPVNVQALPPTPPQVVQEEPAPVENVTMPQIVKDERSIFFDYNKYNVTNDYDTFLQNISSEIVNNRMPEIRVEGNTDSRGSRAYNMALGQQRAESVRQSLTARGVPNAVIRTISYGKERLLAPGNDEEAHAINRRADVLYSGEF